MHIRSAVTVGSDGSRVSLEAVRWASDYARLRGDRLRIVTVGSHKPNRSPIDSSRRQVSRAEFEYNKRLERRSAAAVASALGGTSEDLIDIEVVSGDPVEALVGSAGQGPLVVGTRRLGPLSGIIAGSLSRRVIGRAHGPVTVVSGASSERRRRVVAGVDGGASTDAVVSFALEEARIRGAELVVCHALGAPSRDDRSSRVFASATENAKDSGNDVRVLSESRAGDPVDLLVGQSAEADLVVIGTRSLGPGAGLIRGSVGQRLTVRSRCPVTVVPG